MSMTMSTSSAASSSCKSPSPSSQSRLFTSVKRALKHVGSTKHEFQRHASAGSLSEAVNMESASSSEVPGVTSSTVTSTSRKNTTSSNVSTEDQSVKADSGHGDSDSNSFPSSPQLSQCRKKLLSTSQPHLSTLSDLHVHQSQSNSSTVDTSSVEADDIIYEPRRPRMIQRRPALQLPKPAGSSSLSGGPSIIDPDCHTVISGAVTTIPVGGSPTSTTSGSSGSSANSSTTPHHNAASVTTRLHQDISRLRVDKLELLRQALSAQHEVRQLRQRETQLETDLALAAAEIRRLKNQLKKAAAASASADLEVTSSSSSAVATVVRPPPPILTTRSPRKTVHMQIPL